MHAASRNAQPPAQQRGAAAAMAPAARCEAADPRDALTQTLFAANLVAGTLSADPTLPEPAREQAQTLAGLVRSALGQTRLLAAEPPPALCRELRQLAQAALAQAMQAAQLQPAADVAAAEAGRVPWRTTAAGDDPAAPSARRLVVAGSEGAMQVEIELRWRDAARGL
ncbi:MAG: hypothetical protein JNL85_00320 [Rubrivivax sp.]|nr:hypothetical protein [Rubrivivax sp.]